MKLYQLFPYAQTLFATTGTSMSAAQKEKDKNKNRAERLLERLTFKQQRAYSRTRAITSANGVTRESLPCTDPHVVSDFDVLSEVQEMYARSAILGNVKFLEKMRTEIETAMPTTLAETFGIVIPTNAGILSPKKATARMVSISQYCAYNTVEELLTNASQELLNIIQADIRVALEAEAKAAVLGNQYANKQSVLRMVLQKAADGSVVKDNQATFIIEDTLKMECDIAAFEALDAKIAKEYSDLQNQRNAAMKKIKDAARNLQYDYDMEFQNVIAAAQAQQEAFNAQIQSLRSELLRELGTLKIVE
jgi:hypothetical protein